jgi:hypothetical protein
MAFSNNSEWFHLHQIINKYIRFPQNHSTEILQNMLFNIFDCCNCCSYEYNCLFYKQYQCTDVLLFNFYFAFCSLFSNKYILYKNEEKIIMNLSFQALDHQMLDISVDGSQRLNSNYFLLVLASIVICSLTFLLLNLSLNLFMIQLLYH